MTNTLIFAGGALLMTVAVLFLLLSPFRRRSTSADFSRKQLNAAIYRDEIAELANDLADGSLSQADYDQAQAELQRRLIEDSAEDAPAVPVARGGRSPLVIALVLPLAAALLYLALGNPGALNMPPPEKRVTPDEIERMVEGLAAKLEKEPDNPKGWVMLARSYMAMGRIADAVRAFERIGSSIESDAGLLLGYADALATTTGGFSDKVLGLIDRALKLEPTHPLGLWMRGTAAYDAKKYDKALADWQKLLAVLPPESEDANIVRANIAEINTLLGKTGKPAPAAKVGAGAMATVQGRVELAPALASQAAAQDVVMVIARPADGSRMPAAVLRARVADLPLGFTLDDSLSMSPDRRLSQFAEVTIEARISKSGQAMPQPGDLISAVQTVKLGARNTILRIDATRQ